MGFTQEWGCIQADTVITNISGPLEGSPQKEKIFRIFVGFKKDSQTYPETILAPQHLKPYSTLVYMLKKANGLYFTLLLILGEHIQWGSWESLRLL